MSDKPKTREINHEKEDELGTGHCPKCLKPIHPLDRTCPNCGYDPKYAGRFDDELEDKGDDGYKDNSGEDKFEKMQF